MRNNRPPGICHMTLTRRNAIALFPTSIVAVSGFSQSGAAQTSDPPREIQTLIDNHINGFNTQNIKLFFGVFGDTAIIIDGIAPYRWLNPSRNWRRWGGVRNRNERQPHAKGARRPTVQS